MFLRLADVAARHGVPIDIHLEAVDRATVAIPDGFVPTLPDWAALIADHPDRFVLGADEFFGQDADQTAGAASPSGTWSLLGYLDEPSQRAIACENPRRLYNL